MDEFNAIINGKHRTSEQNNGCRPEPREEPQLEWRNVVSWESSKEKEQTLYQEVNVYRKVQELAEKILEMKRQRRGMDKKISKMERELEDVFDGIKADCLEIEMGLLCRRKKDDGSYEWVIEL